MCVEKVETMNGFDIWSRLVDYLLSMAPRRGLWGASVAVRQLAHQPRILATLERILHYRDL